MVKGKAAYFVIGIVVVTALILRVYSATQSWFNKANYQNDKITELSSKIDSDNQTFILEGDNKINDTIATTTEEINNLAIIESPTSGETISSPLVVKGEAPGPWFFEASFPVKLLDSDGNLITSAPASAQSDPLTENFVPYKALLEFNTIATSGYLMLTNDNPSGLPENELSVKIPVLFLNK